MKILLLEHPRKMAPERCNDIANTPLSSCLLTGYAAAILKSKGHEVEIVEGYLDRLSYREIMDRLRDIKPDILGVHMVYHWKQDLNLFGFLEQAKSEGLASYITAYGFYPTVAFEDIMGDCPAIDSVIPGEPELAFAELAEAISCRTFHDKVPGLAIRNGRSNVLCQKIRLIEDLDSLPFPIRTEAIYRLPEVNIQGSRGCYGKCTFCCINSFYGQGSQWRARSPENIVSEIDSIISERGKMNFYFTDPNFFGPGQKGQERASRLASLLKPRDIRFGLEGRVNDIHDKTIEVLVEAGLLHILIGLESGKDSSLRRMNKMTTVSQNEKAIRILRKHGIEPNVGFIMFEPEASLEDIRINFEFLRRNDLLKNLPVTANVLYHHQIILKGTPAYQKQKKGYLKISPSSNYEGITSFADPKVAVLAGIMRQITNFLFNHLAGIWSGRVGEPKDSHKRYAKANQLLVKTFEDTLTAFEAGEALTDEDREILINEIEKEIDVLIGVSGLISEDFLFCNNR